jgi:hypothetical protein
MKKNAIVKDYRNIPVSGVYNMKEKSNMLCSKMMDIEDVVRVSYNFTPGDLSTLLTVSRRPEAVSLLNISNSSTKERAVKSLTLDKSQTTLDSNNLSKWVFEFDSLYLLREYLYNEIYTLNPQSPFRQIPLNDVPGGKISSLCYDYINQNILDRYRLKEFVLWCTYHELKNNVVPGTGTDPLLNPQIKLLYQKPVYSFNAIPNIGSGTSYTTQPDIDKQKETVSLKQYNDGLYEVYYKQRKSSQYYTFLWYYDAIYERI